MSAAASPAPRFRFRLPAAFLLALGLVACASTPTPPVASADPAVDNPDAFVVTPAWEAERSRLEAALRQNNGHDSARQIAIETLTDNGALRLRLPADRGFASASAQPAEPLRAMLDRIAVAVAEPASTLEIIGHTDSNGSETYNQQLSIERAEAVMHYLEQHGVAAARMRARGLGEAEPIADNRTVQGRATNRRVDIILRPATP